MGNKITGKADKDKLDFGWALLSALIAFLALNSCSEEEESRSPFETANSPRSPFESAAQFPPGSPESAPPPARKPATIAGVASGVFFNARGKPMMVTRGIGSPAFDWGQGGFGGKPSGLSFEGRPFSNEVEQEFSIGRLTFFNGTINAETEATSVSLKITLKFDQGRQEDFDFGFDLITTTNHQRDQDADADVVQFQSTQSEKTIEIQGKKYHLQLEFGETSQGGFSKLERFFVWESHSASAELRATITAEAAPAQTIAR